MIVDWAPLSTNAWKEVKQNFLSSLKAMGQDFNINAPSYTTQSGTQISTLQL